MSTSYTYPGVYVEELPSSVRSIIGVGTSITAFVGRASKGPTDKAVLIHSFADFTRIFGGLWKKSKMSYSVYQYFQNGGVDAIIVRVVATKNSADRTDKTVHAAPATFTLHYAAAKAATDAKPATDAKTAATEKVVDETKTGLKLRAANPGLWGEKLAIILSDADGEKKDQDDDQTYFNLAIHQKVASDECGPLLEMFRNVSLDPEKPRFIRKILVDGVSAYLRVDCENKDIPSKLVFDEAKPEKNPKYVLNSGADDGDELDSRMVVGDEDAKTGMYALKDADLFNLLCIPAYSESDKDRKVTYSAALKFCNDRRAILLVDPPAGELDSWDSTAKVLENISAYIDRDKNGAIFFPRIVAPDPLEEYRLNKFDPCGVVAGVIARTDAQRGVWKAPAGIEAVLSGVPDLAVRLTNEENGELNPKGVNCLRIFPDVGRVIWGSRTLRGADSLADQWKYLSVRRTALYIEETLFRGTQWVVFEPNDERLWSQIRLNVGAFMHSLFVKGAFQGADPKKAYMVKCDSETTTQTDIDAGIVNVLVGFAPLKPAEFVVLKIQQLAGQELE
jgi:phage tail sheath protein FI